MVTSVAAYIPIFIFYQKVQYYYLSKDQGSATKNAALKTIL